MVNDGRSIKNRNDDKKQRNPINDIDVSYRILYIDSVIE